VQFMKDVYLDSQVTIGVLSNNTAAAVPGIDGSRPRKNIAESQAGELLTSAQTIAVRDWVNEIAGSTRMLAHGQPASRIAAMRLCASAASCPRPGACRSTSRRPRPCRPAAGRAGSIPRCRAEPRPRSSHRQSL
jgi:hypothetical protein